MTVAASPLSIMNSLSVKAQGDLLCLSHSIGPGFPHISHGLSDYNITLTSQMIDPFSWFLRHALGLCEWHIELGKAMRQQAEERGCRVGSEAAGYELKQQIMRWTSRLWRESAQSLHVCRTKGRKEVAAGSPIWNECHQFQRWQPKVYIHRFESTA